MGLRTIKAISTLHNDDDGEVSIILFKKLTYLLFSNVHSHGLYTHYHISSHIFISCTSFSSQIINFFFHIYLSALRNQRL